MAPAIGKNYCRLDWILRREDLRKTNYINISRRRDLTGKRGVCPGSDGIVQRQVSCMFCQIPRSASPSGVSGFFFSQEGQKSIPIKSPEHSRIGRITSPCIASETRGWRLPCRLLLHRRSWNSRVNPEEVSITVVRPAPEKRRHSTRLDLFGAAVELKDIKRP